MTAISLPKKGCLKDGDRSHRLLGIPQSSFDNGIPCMMESKS